jgi:hypothetical protein
MVALSNLDMATCTWRTSTAVEAPLLTGQLNHFGPRFGVALAAAALLAAGNLAVASSFQLGDGSGLLELRDGTQHLTHQDCCRRVLGKEVGGGRGDQRDAELTEMVMAGELHC